MPVFKFNNIRIAGIAAAVPPNPVKTESFKDRFGSEEVDKFMTMTGITETRRTSEHQTASDLAYSAAEHLLKKKRIDKSEIGALVFGTHSPDYRRPASAFIIQKRLGLSTDCAVFDISLGCSSLVYGIQVLSSMMSNSDIKKGLLVVGDTAAKTTNPNDRASIMITGEGSAAILLEKDENAEPLVSLVRSDGSGYRYLIVPGGSYRNLNTTNETEICEDGNERSLNNSFMQGTSVFTFTISDVPAVIRDYWELTGTDVDSYDCFAFHQANRLILQKIAKKLKIPEDKMPLTLPRFGNTSGASPAITLCDTFGDDQEGELKVLFCGFGVGLSWGTFSAKLRKEDIFPIIEDDSYFEEGVIKSVKDL